MLKNRLGFIGFLSLFNLPLCLYYASFFAPNLERSPWYAILTFVLASLGHFCIYFIAGCLVLILLPSLFKSVITPLFILWCTVVVALMHLVLAVDAHVFALYRFHVTLAMLDLFFNAGGQVISFSEDMIISIVIELAVIIVYSLIAVGFALLCAIRGCHSRKFILGCILCYVMANGIHAYAFAVSVLPVTEIQNRLPVYKPLTMNSTLVKLGLISQENATAGVVVPASYGMFAYPKNPLEYDRQKEDLNVLYVLIDSVRGDMLTPEIMPYTYEFLQDKAYVFADHQASSNSTRGGVFGLFYGLPPSYWQVALSSGIPSATVKAVMDSNYRLGVFTSAMLLKPEFNKTVFATVPNLRTGSRGNDIFERDWNCINDFKEFVKEDRDKRFFAFVFVDNVHSAAFPKDAPRPFEPSWDSVNQLELNADTDPTPYFNCYKNSVHYADTYVKDLMDFLRQEGLLDKTVVVISSDHGEEFNDNKDNYWGHNSNFTKAQMHIPLVIRWPGKSGGTVSRRTTAYDLSATVLPRIFGVSNQVSDYSIGQDLFEGKEQNYYLAGSYLENAIVEKDRIVLIDSMGMLRFLDNNYRPSSNTTRNEYLLDALRLFHEEYLRQD